MGWPTKTNCDAPRPTLGNPASLLPYVYNPRPLTEQERHAFCNLPDPDPRPVAARPYTEAITLTDADDLADYLPSASPASVSPRLAG